jgi:hypothetical protein
LAERKKKYEAEEVDLGRKLKDQTAKQTKIQETENMIKNVTEKL